MSEFKTPPLKRHPSLQPLSRDHYVGLVQGRHLLKAAEGNAVDRRAALADFVDAWDQDIRPHFDDEERLVAPLADEANRTRLQQEHDRLRALADEAREHRRKTDPGATWMANLGQMLTDHIRWEERDLFPAVEASSGEALDSLQPEADRIEASRTRSRGQSAE